MSSSEDENLFENMEIERKGKEIIQNLLPTKSRPIYLKTYETFMKWRKEKRVHSFAEGVFLTYFDELSKKLQPPSVWSTYSMLKTTLQIKQGVILKNYLNLTSLLKKISTGYKAKKSKVLTASEIEAFINNAPNDGYLATKVALIFGISGACRGMELTNITTDDVETDSRLQAINLPNTKTNKERKFVITGEYLNIVKAYQALRPNNVQTNRFFLNYQRGKCTKQVIGKNKFAKMPKDIATFLNLSNPELYTGHCFRRTSATLLANSGANLTTIKRHGGWRSDQVAEGYIEESLENKYNITKQITDGIKIVPLHEPKHDKILNPVMEPNPSTSRNLISNLIQNESHEGRELHNERFSSSQSSPTFTQQTATTQNIKTRINLPEKNISLNITNCTNCTFNFS